MRKIKIVLYNIDFKDDLDIMLKEFADSVFKEDAMYPDANDFVEAHNGFVYIALCDGVPIGFSSYSYNQYYGLRKPTIGNDYIYVKEGYRKTKAFLLLSLQTGLVIQDFDCNLEHYFCYDSGSVNFIDRIKGKEVYRAFEYKKEDVLNEFNKLKRLL